MDDFAQIPIVEDPEELRCPCLLLLDVSHSMEGRSIEQLNLGIKQFAVELCNDPLAIKRVEVGVITFGVDVQIDTELVVARDFRPEQFVASGLTPMCEAIQTGIQLIDQRKAAYRKSGTSYFRPWIILITDGAPTDAEPAKWYETKRMVKEGERKKEFAFFVVGVKDANFELLQELSERQVLRLKGLKFRPFFEWLSASLGEVSRSTPGEEFPLQPPWGWATVPRQAGDSEDPH